jgi:DNA-binding NarL/FixJ family response regulator
MIRVLIADDSQEIRTVLRSLLEMEPGLSCVGCVSTTNEVARAARDGNADIVLLDYRLPESGGFGAMDELAKTSPSTKVIIHSGWNEPDVIAEVQRRGAAFLTKGTDIDAMFAMIRKVHEGS